MAPTAATQTRRTRAFGGACLLCALLSAPPAPASEPAVAPATIAKLQIHPAPPGRLPWVVFDERSGLPQNTIVDLQVDARGFVWAATQDGPARYNGHAWETVPLPRSMRSNYARVMRLSKQGGLWVGSCFTGEFLRVMEGGRVTHRIPTPGRWALATILAGPTRSTLYLLSTETDFDRIKNNDMIGLIEAVEVDVPGVGLP